MRSIIVIILMTLSMNASGLLYAVEKPLLWPIGETLTYKVTWSVFRLGTLRIAVLDTSTMNNKRVYHAQLNIDSNPLLFFVNMHSEFHTYFDDEIKTHFYESEDKIDGVSYKTKYEFNYTDSLMFMNMTDMENPDKRIIRQQPLYGTVLDGTSLLYYARKHAGKTGVDTTLYLFEGEINPAYIDFKGEDKPKKVEGLKKSVDTFYLLGDIPGKGIAGLSGKFRGWFAQHPQKPPIKAKLKVFIGNVVLELESSENCTFEALE